MTNSAIPAQDPKADPANEKSTLSELQEDLQTWSTPQLLKLSGQDAESGSLNGPDELDGPSAVS